ncbi:hypothetical protein [Roseimicrobium sp. ORNL1]|uniref:hypothetical protein n=1 Tax=Roseimicrobium sp. ORNL1 TaxID=2711231 RepID=UPI0013E1C2D2|nr:hypothetical protein [Roseimicrobium sp. ORNL1]QIF00435.1 hypothetical protein G5S37_02470 [Roseimicrobium sp. ORNL1]
MLLLTVMLVSCKREHQIATVSPPQVPGTEMVVTVWKVEGDLVVWLNGEPLGIVRGPVSTVRVSDTPLKEGVNEIRITGPSAQDLSLDDLSCALVIKGQSTPVELNFEEPRERRGGFRLLPEEWKAAIEPGVLKSGSAGKWKAWSLSLVEALCRKDSDRLKAMVEGFADMSDTDVSPFLSAAVQVSTRVTSTDQLEVREGHSVALLTARPESQTGAARALIEAKAGEVELTMKQILVLQGRDGSFYLDTPKGWKKVLNLEP